MSTFELLQVLQSEVGSRRAGTEGERQAQDWLKAQCLALGLAVELDEFTFVGSELYLPVLVLIGLAWAVTFGSLEAAGQSRASLLVFGLGVVYAAFIHKRLEARLAGTRSYNVVAGLGRPFSEYAADPAKGPAFLIGAHYDTPRNSPAWLHTALYWFLNYLLPLAVLLVILDVFPFLLLLIYALLLLVILVPMVVAYWCGLAWLAKALLSLGKLMAGFASALFAFLAGFNSWIGPWLNGGRLAIVVLTFGLLLLFALDKLVGKKSDSPGADDNGSGTALVLELARRLSDPHPQDAVRRTPCVRGRCAKESPPASMEVFFAWWGAEERGLIGSKSFVRHFDSMLDKDKLYLINADCVGRGEWLMVLDGQGLVRRHLIEPVVVERIERIAARLGVKTTRFWGEFVRSDHYEWVKRGYKNAVWLTCDTLSQPPLPFRFLAGLLRLPNARLPRLKHIHSPEDSIEGINAWVLEQATDVAEAYIREVDVR